MNRDKEWLKDTLNDKKAASNKNLVELVHGRDKSYMNGKMVAFSVALNLIDQLDEPEITEAQAWETLAPRFRVSANELERQVLDGFIAMTAEEIELESDKIKKLADGIKKLHAENEELKAKLPEKVVVPQFVADWIEHCKENNLDLYEAFGHSDMSGEVSDFIGDMDADEFARAWLDYPNIEVEKEPLYFISFPTPNSGHINMWRNTDMGSYYFAKSSNLTSQDGYKCAFTEKEIKDYDPRYWAFAQPVEEEEK